MKKFYTIIVGICIGFAVMGQPFTANNRGNANNLTNITSCALNYTCSFEQPGYNHSTITIYDNGNAINVDSWTLVGCTKVGGPGEVRTNIKYDKNGNEPFYVLINPTTKTITFSQTPPDCSTDPEITVSETELSNISTCIGSASAPVSFTVSGNSLLDDITLSIEGDDAGDYELSTTLIAKGDGNVPATTVTVNLKEDAAVGTKNEAYIVITTEGDEKTIQLSGYVLKKELKLSTTLVEFTPTCKGNTFARKAFTITGSCLAGSISVALENGYALEDEAGNAITTITNTDANNGITVYLTSSKTATINPVEPAVTLMSDEGLTPISIGASGLMEDDILQIGSLSGSLDYSDCSKCTSGKECIQNPAGTIPLQGYCLGDDVVVTAPNNFEVFDGTNWVSSFTITDNNFTTNVQVRLIENLPSNTTYEGDVTIALAGNTHPVPVQGKSEITETSLIVNKNGIFNTFGTDGTVAQSITVTGTGLTESVTAKAPVGFVIASSENGSYETAVTLPSSGGTVWVRPADNTPADVFVRGNVTFSSTTATGVAQQAVEVMHGAKEMCTITANTTIPEDEVWVCNGTFSIAHDVTLNVEGELHLPTGYQMNSGTLHVKPTGAVIMQEEFILTNGKQGSTLKKVEVINEGRMELHGTPAKGEFHMATNQSVNGVSVQPDNNPGNALYFTNKGMFGISNCDVIIGQNGQSGGAAFYNHTDAIVQIDNKDFPEREVYLGGEGSTESILFTRPGDKTTAAEQLAAAGNFKGGYVSIHLHKNSHFVVKNTSTNTLIGQPGDGRQEIAGELYVYDGDMTIGFQNGSGGQTPTISGGMYIIDQTPSDCHQTGMINIHAGGGNMQFEVEGNLWATGLNGQNANKSGDNEIDVKPGGTVFIGNVGANMPSDNYKIHVEGEGTLYYCGNYSEFGDAVGTVESGGNLYYAPTYYEYDNEGNPTDTNDEGTCAVVVAGVGGKGNGQQNIGNMSFSYEIEVLSYDDQTQPPIITANLKVSSNGKSWNYPKTYSLCTTCTDSDNREFFTIDANGSFRIRTYTTGDFSVSKGAISEIMKDFEGNEISSAEECEELFLTPPKEPKEFSWLPITLAQFKATPTAAGGARIEWITQTETNNDYFTLYRSYNGVVFEAIATKGGAGTTTVPQFYKYDDKNFITNIAYYKLEQTDYNGKKTMSNVVAVQNMYLSTFEIEQLQNNGNGNYSITFLFPDNETENHISIYNIMNVKKAEYNFAAGSISAQAEVNLYPSGTYIVEHSNGTRKTIRKIVVK